MNKLQDGHKRKVQGLWDSNKSAGLKEKYKGNEEDYLRATKKRLDRRITAEYSEHGNLYSDINTAKRKFLPGVKKWLAPVLEKSVDVVIAHWINDSIYAIINSPEARKTFIQKLEKYYNFESEDRESPESEAVIKDYLIKAATIYATENISEILSAAYSNLDVKISPVDTLIFKDLYDKGLIQ